MWKPASRQIAPPLPPLHTKCRIKMGMFIFFSPAHSISHTCSFSAVLSRAASTGGKIILVIGSEKWEDELLSPLPTCFAAQDKFHNLSLQHLLHLYGLETSGVLPPHHFAHSLCPQSTLDLLWEEMLDRKRLRVCSGQSTPALFLG